LLYPAPGVRAFWQHAAFDKLTLRDLIQS